MRSGQIIVIAGFVMINKTYDLIEDAYRWDLGACGVNIVSHGPAGVGTFWHHHNLDLFRK